MLLQANGGDSWFDLPSVALCVEFTDVMKFADFVTKIGNLAHYQQLVLPRDDSESDEQILTMNPMYSVLVDYTRVDVTQGYIEIAVDGKTLRFTQNAPRRYTTRQNKCPKLSKDKTAAIFIPGVILQGKRQAAQQYDDVCDVDLYIEIEDADLVMPPIKLPVFISSR
ncbi:unnamed protein product, partial [Mesorhabditis belari]|uniref:Uncharacterized protein n=1 Tax=Mesorhabditis belari TaxID=2138241 RepID=A0AAF3EM39_9BILA